MFTFAIYLLLMKNHVVYEINVTLIIFFGDDEKALFTKTS